MTRLVLVGVLVSIVAAVGIISLIRTRRLQERFALLWLLAAAGAIVLGLWKQALDALSSLLGIAYPPSALFLVVSAFLVGVLLHLTISVSRLSSQNQQLAQRLALLDERLRGADAGGSADEPPVGVEEAVEREQRARERVVTGVEPAGERET